MAVIPSDLTLGTGSTIGRYFAIVSVIPSVVLAVWIDLTIATGAATGSPSLGNVIHNLGQNQPTQGIVVIVVAMGLALLLHPLQRGITQILEGYWTGTAVGRSLAARRIIVHSRHLNGALTSRTRIQRTLNKREHRGANVNQTMLTGTAAQRRKAIELLVAEAAAEAKVEEYPLRPEELMPTRLGNMLRRYESRVGAAYDLPILDYATHINMVADPSHTAVVNDQRNLLDLCTRLVMCSLIGAIATAALMWPHGLWLILSLLPYGAACISYRGAVAAADSYGQALTAWSDLNRFKLYESLRLQPPPDSDVERRQNRELEDLLLGNRTYFAHYADALAGGEDADADASEPDPAAQPIDSDKQSGAIGESTGETSIEAPDSEELPPV